MNRPYYVVSSKIWQKKKLPKSLSLWERYRVYEAERAFSLWFLPSQSAYADSAPRVGALQDVHF